VPVVVDESSMVSLQVTFSFRIETFSMLFEVTSHTRVALNENTELLVPFLYFDFSLKFSFGMSP